ncbi:sensor histidine kinase [Chryseobacterium wanjuense]
MKKYADIYNNESKYEIKEYSLYDLIQEKKKLFAEIAKSRNTEILNNISKNSTTIISKNILSAIIHNLLDNAVKFTKDGIIIFGSSEKEDSLIITLRDSGIGMDPDKIEYYNNLQKNTGKEKLVLQKYGMGLHFIMQLLQMIDGFIIIEKLDRGTSFKLLLKKQKDE